MINHQVGTGAWVDSQGDVKGACWIDIQEEVDTANRVSYITAYVTVHSRYEYDSIYMSGSVTINANGGSYGFSRYAGRWISLKDQPISMFATQTITVPHAKTGEASISVSFSPDARGWFRCYSSSANVSFYCNAMYGSGTVGVNLYKMPDITPPPTPDIPTPDPEPEPEGPGRDEYTPATPDVYIDWDAVGDTKIQSTAPAGGNPITHLPYIIYNGIQVPLGRDASTRMIDEGFNSSGERCWTLLIYDGLDYPLEFKYLGSATAGIDIFMCGGGGAGGDGTIIADEVNEKGVGGGGGAGGCMRNVIGIPVERDTTYYITIGNGGEHGQDGESTFAFNYEAGGGKAGFSGYDVDNEGDKDKDEEESSESGSEGEGEEKKEKKSTAGYGGEATRSNLTGISFAGGNGGVISAEENTPPTDGKEGLRPFRISTLDETSLAFKYLNLIYGSSGGGGAARYNGSYHSQGGAAGSPMAGRGGKAPTEGVVNHINGPLGEEGVTNSGCGGGGGGCAINVQTFGGKGGSGIVIIRNTRTPDVAYDGLNRDASGSASKVVTWTTVSTSYKQTVISGGGSITPVTGTGNASLTGTKYSSSSSAGNIAASSGTSGSGGSSSSTPGIIDSYKQGFADGSKSTTTTSSKPTLNKTSSNVDSIANGSSRMTQKE